MNIMMILAIIADLLLAVLLTAVSGFILQGVNNTGAMMPEAALYVGFILLCIVASALAAILRKRQPLATGTSSTPRQVHSVCRSPKRVLIVSADTSPSNSTPSSFTVSGCGAHIRAVSRTRLASKVFIGGKGKKPDGCPELGKQSAGPNVLGCEACNCGPLWAIRESEWKCDQDPAGPGSSRSQSSGDEKL